ncbi:MAG: hypothetical protein ACP5D2_02120 [Candidatus Nanoarchaeia archaeon]
MKEETKKEIKRGFEKILDVIRYVFIFNFISMTGVWILPQIAERFGVASIQARVYALSMMVSVLYITNKIIGVIFKGEKIKW